MRGDLPGNWSRIVFGFILVALVVCWISLCLAGPDKDQKVVRLVPPPPQPFSISVDANRLIDGSGHKVFLHGVNRDDMAYACADGHGIFIGPVGQASVTAMQAWNINAVRLTLNEDCWLGINRTRASYSGPNYRREIAEYVKLLEANKIYVILDLQWAAPGSYLSNELVPMADADHSPSFWRSVAATFANDRGVLFDLYNEPYGLSWSCWKRGGCTTSCPVGNCRGVKYAATGMDPLIAAVRKAESSGWHHPVIIAGLGSSNDLSGWRDYRPADPARQEVAGAHVYNDRIACEDLDCWNSEYREVAEQVPLVADEFGDAVSHCAWSSYLDTFMNFMQSYGSGYLAWVWNAGARCPEPSLITDWNGNATSYGAGYKSHLLELF
jgi:Cellulase (glycosyl hydrolase family 5)